MTAEELKAHVRTYADEHFPGWGASAVSVEATADPAMEETLLVLPLSRRHPPESASPPAPRSSPTGG